MTESAHVLVVVFDTNALLPLLVGFTPRAGALRRAWQSRHFDLFITPQTLAEVERVLTYPRVQRNFRLARAEATAVVDATKSLARLLPGMYKGVTAVRADESDNIFLAAALEAGADYLVTRPPFAQPQVLPRHAHHLTGAVCSPVGNLMRPLIQLDPSGLKAPKGLVIIVLHSL